MFLTRYGPNIRRNVKFLEREIGQPGPHDLLIKIHAASLNPVDYKIIWGFALIITQPKRPFALGFDLAGTVMGKGEAVEDFEIGDKVYAKVPWDQMGTIATEILVRSDALALKPQNISFEEAAAMPLISCTVFDALALAEIKKGARVLIIGGSGGTGSFAVQYLKYLGAYVYATTSTPNVAMVEALGADEVIDYKKQDFRRELKEIDLVLDTVGGKYPGQSIKVVKRGGKIISIAGHHDDDTLKEMGIARFFRILFQIKGSILMFRMKRKGVFYKHVWSFPNQEKLNYIRKLIESGKIKAVVDQVYDFKDAIDGLLYLKTQRAKGKVIIRMNE
ncbi:MAG: NADP-dependent oxidoreductase [Bacteroidota bacterium]